MAGYLRDTLLSADELEAARQYAREAEWYNVFQYYNLFDCYRYDIHDEVPEFVKTLKRYSGQSILQGAYLLKYVPGSFCRMHQDHESKLTIVTLLDSEDLVGGDAVVQTVYEQKDRPADHFCARPEAEIERPPYGQGIILEVVPVKDGESLVYGNDLLHGVSKVEKGQRTVLITWFR